MKLCRRSVVIPTAGSLAACACLFFLPGTAAAVADDCCTTTSTSDFDGDGYDDAAVGDPYATVDGVREAGAVTVLLGDSDGRIGEGAARTVITRATLGETPAAGDHFGFDVALARSGHNDACAGVLVGAPGADLGAAADAGIAYLVSDLPDVEGTPQLEAAVLTQADASGAVEAGDGFGHAVMITGTNQEDRRRLVVGAPGEDAGSVADAGAVTVFEVDEQPEGLAELRQGRRGPLGGVRLPDSPEPGDRFGSSLAGGLLDLPETSGTEVGQALLIGAPGDTVSGRDGSGSVTVLQEKYEAAVLLSQDRAGVPGTAEPGDQFGYSLALAPRAGTRAAVLAVGAPGEDAGSTGNTGSVTLFADVGERIVPRTSIDQATAGVPGTNEAGDRFGHALAFGWHGRRLLVGVPTEDVGSTADAGAVQPVEVSGTQPLRFPGSIDENAAGTAGSVGTGNRFGDSLGALSGTSEHVLTVASPYAGRGSVYVLSDGAQLPPRSWVAGAGGGRFGWSVSN